MGKPNLILSYQIGTGTIVGFDSVGNEIEEMVSKEIKATVREGDRNEITAPAPGTGQYQVYLLGRCVEPKLLPQGVGLESTVSARLIDAATNSEQTGEFRFLPVVQHRFPEYTQQMGTYIEGIFTVNARV